MILVAASMAQVFSACDSPFEWNADLKDFVEDGRSILKLSGFTAKIGDETKTIVPSGQETVVTLAVLNPRSIELACDVDYADESLFAVLPSVSVLSPQKVAFSFTPALLAERKDLAFTVNLSSPETENTFPSEAIMIHCNTPPHSVENIGAAFDASGRAFTAFRLPCTAVDDDLSKVRIDYKIDGSTGDGETVTLDVNETCICGKRTPVNGSDLLGDPDSLNRYFKPDTASYGSAYDFSVTLIDSEGLESETARIKSLASGSSPTIAFTLNPSYGAITFSPSTVTVARGAKLTLVPSLSGATGFHWYRDNALQATTSTFTWSTTTATQPGQYIINVDAMYKGFACTGSIRVTVTW
jgi:hypothetical protein